LGKIIQAHGRNKTRAWEKIRQALGKNRTSAWEKLALWKIHKFPEIMTGAHFHFEIVKLCMLDKNYALHIT
jgi:hypothetical protein